MGTSRQLIIFTKPPEPGQVKTRLQPLYSVKQSLAIHTALMRHTLTLGQSLLNSGIETQCWLSHPATSADIEYIKNEFDDIIFKYQQGSNLGDRMAHCLQTTLKTHKSTVIIGADCISLTPAVLHHAFSILDKPEATVFAPAIDGGYVLVGSNISRTDYLNDIPWGTHSVMSVTRQRMRQQPWYELPLQYDLDTSDDINTLKKMPSKTKALEKLVQQIISIEHQID